MKTFEAINYSKNEDLCLDLYLPDTDNFDLFVYFHGGGLEKGSRNDSTVRLIAPYLTQKGVAVASLDYRMYPDFAYPDFLRDAAEGVCWLSKNINNYGKCERIFVGGSSAGGYISMMLCYDARWYTEAGTLPVPVVGYLHDSGQPTCHYNVLKYRGIDSRRVMIDDSAPLYHIGTATEYPPQMFLVADDDMKNRYEQTMLVLSTLRHFGYDESKISYRLMHGKHCAHGKQVDENGESVLGKIIFDFISTVK